MAALIWLKGKKAYIIATLMGLVGVVNVATGDLTLTEFLASPEARLVLEALGLATLRAGIAKRL